MADAKERTQWNHTAALMALTANCHLGKGQRVSMLDFHPHELAKARKRGRRKVSPEKWDKIIDRTEKQLVGKHGKARSKTLTPEEREQLKRDAATLAKSRM